MPYTYYIRVHRVDPDNYLEYYVNQHYLSYKLKGLVQQRGMSTFFRKQFNCRFGIKKSTYTL